MTDDFDRLPPGALESERDDAAQQLVGLMRNSWSIAEVRELADGLHFPDYRSVLEVCRAEKVTPDDVLVFLGIMTDEQGFATDRRLGDVASLMIGRFQQQHQKGLRRVPEAVTDDPKAHFAGRFRFMLVQFSGRNAKANTLPLLEIFEEIVIEEKGQPKTPTSLFDRRVELSDYGKTMYFRLLLQLGNLECNLKGNDPNLRFDDFEAQQRAKYKTLFQSKITGLRDHVAKSH